MEENVRRSDRMSRPPERLDHGDLGQPRVEAASYVLDKSVTASRSVSSRSSRRTTSSMRSAIARLKLDEALRRQKLERADEELQFKRAELRRMREILLLKTKVKAADLRCLSATSSSSGRSHSERVEQRLSKRELSRFSGEMTNSDDAILHWKQEVDQHAKSDELELTPLQPLLLNETGSQDTASATK